MFWLKILRNFIRILREGQTPAQIAGGFALGSIVGLTPDLTLQGVLVWLIILVLNINLSAAILSFTLFSLFAYLLDPLFHWLGYLLLVRTGALRELWTTLYNAPVAPLTRFNNTVVLGSLVAALVLSVPFYLGMKRFVVGYRTHIHARVERWKLYQAVKKSTLVRWYDRVRSLATGD